MRSEPGYFEETHLGKPHDIKLLRRLYPFIRSQRTLLLVSIGLVVLITLIDVALPYVTKLAIDGYIVPSEDRTPPGRHPPRRPLRNDSCGWMHPTRRPPSFCSGTRRASAGRGPLSTRRRRFWPP